MGKQKSLSVPEGKEINFLKYKQKSVEWEIKCAYLCPFLFIGLMYKPFSGAWGVSKVRSLSGGCR